MSAKYKNILKLSRRSLIHRRSRVKSLNHNNTQHTVNVQSRSTLDSDDYMQNTSNNDNESPGIVNICDEFTNSDVDTIDNNDDKYVKFLRSWTPQFNIQKNAVTMLLKFFKENEHPNLPSDCRTLLHTPHSREVIDCHPGQYCHIGLKKAIDYYIRNCTDVINQLDLDINIDGVPISRSSSKSFW